MPNEVIPVEPKGGSLAMAPGVPTIYASTMALDTPEGRLRAVNALGLADMIGSDVAGAGILNVVDFILHQADTKTEEGEIVQYPRMVVWLDTGESVSFSSVYLQKAVWSYHQLIQRGPWNPPLRIDIKVVKRGAKSPYICRVLGQ